jgi:putrescine importer
VLIVSYIAAVMCAQAGSSRLLYVMGRDGVMPLKWFAYLHPRLRTPVFNIALMGIVMLAGEWVDVETAASCVNFGAFSAFLAVNLCVFRLPGGTWKLVQSAGGALASLWLLVSLHRTALTVGLGWLLVGLAYLAYRTRGFRRTVLQPAQPV